MASSLSLFALFVVAVAPICLHSAVVLDDDLDNVHDVEKRQTTGCNIYCSNYNAALCGAGMTPITSMPPATTTPTATLVYSRSTAYPYNYYVQLYVPNIACGSVCYNCTAGAFYSCTTPNVYLVYNTLRTACATCYTCF